MKVFNVIELRIDDLNMILANENIDALHDVAKIHKDLHNLFIEIDRVVAEIEESLYEYNERKKI